LAGIDATLTHKLAVLWPGVHVSVHDDSSVMPLLVVKRTSAPLACALAKANELVNTTCTGKFDNAVPPGLLMVMGTR
jgi:hypothetical protein